MSEPLRVGDPVRFSLGRRMMTGFVAEDRGAVGGRERHLFRVLVPMEPFEPAAYELFEDELSPVADDAAEVPSKAKIIQYLKGGGLVSILLTNGAGRPRPRAWLRLDTLGNVTHTFNEELGAIGGAHIPTWAIERRKVFFPRHDDVLDFLKSFGLNRSEAEDVLHAVGTEPI